MPLSSLCVSTFSNISETTEAQWWAYRIGMPLSSLCVSTFSNISETTETQWWVYRISMPLSSLCVSTFSNISETTEAQWWVYRISMPLSSLCVSTFSNISETTETQWWVYRISMPLSSLCVSTFSNISETTETQWWAYRIGMPLSSICVYVCVTTFSNISSETVGPIEAKFHMEPLWDRGTKVCSNGQGTWPRWRPCPYMVKTLKNLLRNQKANDLETWYAASGARVLPSLFKWWPWVDLDLFYGRSDLVLYAFVWEKGKTMDFSETIVVYDIKVGRCSQLQLQPMYGKKKSSSLEPLGRWPWKLLCSIGYSNTTKFVQVMTLGWPWPILRQGQIWSPMLLYGKG